MASDSTSFADVLKRFRNAAGLTQEELALRARLSRNAVSALERGIRQSPRRDTVALLAAALALSDEQHAALLTAARLQRLRGALIVPDAVLSSTLSTSSASAARQSATTANLPENSLPQRALDARSHNLPVQPNALVGREREVGEVCTLLRRRDVRLVTLTGPGGIGKTRVSLQVGAELVNTVADGVWFVSLSRLADPALVLPTNAQTLGLQEAGGRPLTDLLRDYVRTRQLLLLDNFERVAEAGPVVAELLSSSPGLTVLVTSRAAYLLGAAAAVRERIGVHRAMFWHWPLADDIISVVAAAEAGLGPERWAAAFAAGQALTPEEAVAEALHQEMGQ